MQSSPLETFQAALATVNQLKSEPSVQEWLDAEAERRVQAHIQRSAQQYMARFPCITQADIDWLMYIDTKQLFANSEDTKSLLVNTNNMTLRRGTRRTTQEVESEITPGDLLPFETTHLWGGGARQLVMSGWGVRGQQRG